MKRKFFVATLAIGIMSTSVSILAFAQNNNEVVLSAEVAMMDSNINEAKQSIVAYIQEDMQKQKCPSQWGDFDKLGGDSQ